jgi:hypothetical protein
MKEMALIKGQLVTVSDKLQAWFPWVPLIEKVVKVPGSLQEIPGMDWIMGFQFDFFRSKQSAQDT